MHVLIKESLFFGVAVSIIGYELGLWMKKRLKTPLCNPLLISILFVILVLCLCKVDYGTYYEGSKYLSYLLTPATVCLAIPLYKQIELIKKNPVEIIGAVCAGVLSSMLSVFIIAKIFRFTHEQYVTMLPKSITTAIGIGLSEKLGGIVTITAIVIIVTGIAGNVLAETVFRVMHINNRMAKGLAIGTSSHAVGTAKAMEIGEAEGAMSSLSIVISGILTVLAVSAFAGFM